MLKRLLFCSLLLSVKAMVFSQVSDTVISYLDNDEKLTSQAKAVLIMKLYKNSPADDYWHRDVYERHQNKELISRGTSLDANGMIKQGNFITYNRETGSKTSEGMYENNKKTGEWKWFHKNGDKQGIRHYENDKMIGSNMGWYEDGKVSDSFVLDNKGNGAGKSYHKDGTVQGEGLFTEGQKTGKWVYFYKTAPHGKSIEVVFEKDSATNYTCYTETGELQKKDCALEREASFKKGQEGWVKYLISKMEKFDTYKYLGLKKMYTAIVKFIVTPEGKIDEATVEIPGNSALDAYAIEVITKSPAWIPAVQYNQKLKAYRRQPITFVTE